MRFLQLSENQCILSGTLCNRMIFRTFFQCAQFFLLTGNGPQTMDAAWEGFGSAGMRAVICC